MLILCGARLLGLGEYRNIVALRSSLRLFQHARWPLGLNSRCSQRSRQRHQHAKRSNRFQIFPPAGYSLSGPICSGFHAVPADLSKLDCLNRRLDTRHLAAEENESVRIPDWKASIACFLLVADVSPLQIAVNIGPKLLQLIPEGVDAHLKCKTGEIRRKTTIGSGIVDVGNGNRSCIARKLGNVEHITAGVFPGDENAADGIAKAVSQKRPFPSRK